MENQGTFSIIWKFLCSDKIGIFIFLEYLCYPNRPIDTGGQRGIAPNNSLTLCIRVLYTVLFNHFSVDFYPI